MSAAVKITGGITILSFIIIVIAVATPGWSVITYTNHASHYSTSENDRFSSEVSIGIWYTKACLSADGVAPVCNTFSYKELKDASQRNSGISMTTVSIVEAEIETTIGAIEIIVAGILIFIYSVDLTRQILGILAVLLLLTGGILVAIPTGRFAHLLQQFNGLRGLFISAGVDIKIGFPYSLLISAVGISCCFSAFLTLIIIIYKNSNGGRMSQSQGYTISSPQAYVPTTGEPHTSQLQGYPASQSPQAYAPATGEPRFYLPDSARMEKVPVGTYPVKNPNTYM